MTEALLTIKNLSIGIYSGIYPGGKKQILSSVKDISFDLYPGEILGLAGESGSGKSLTALSIPGLLSENKKITGGAIYYYGRNNSEKINLLNLKEDELKTIRGKEISMIFQEPFTSLNPLMKIKDQVAETLALHGEKDKTGNYKRVKELFGQLHFSEPEKVMESYPHRLSGGMCQRVMIALAVICRPGLLIADEPTTALDQNTQTQILNLLKEINRVFGTSILFISHDLGLLKNFCSRLLVMYSGRILEEGNTEEIFAKPSHEYTKGLLASIPNKANRGKDLTAIPGRIPTLEEGRPSGCPFHPRCGRVTELCRLEFPAARAVNSSHKTHCILEEI